MNGLLNENYVVLNLSVLDEAALVFRDDPGQDVFESVGYDFCDDFIPCIAQRDGPISGEILHPFLFGD